jgi:acetyl-CoA acyltransferase 1
MNRLNHLADQLAKEDVAGKQPDDVVICSAVRTPITKAKKGLLKDTPPEVMLSFVLRAAAERAKLSPKEVQDICIGNNLQPGAGEITNRMGMFLADFPDTVPIVAINRLCSSGLESCAIIASKIKSGVIDIGIGGGV